MVRIINISTPNRSYSERIKRINPYHVREYSEQELLTLLKCYFSGVELWYQGFAPEYVDRVRAYTAAIPARKARLPWIVRLVINRVYRPMEMCLPRRVPNHIIENLLRLRYPRPSISEMIISPERMDEVIVYIAVCRGPLDVGR